MNAGVAGEICLESAEKFSLSKHEEIFSINYFGVLSWVEEWLPLSKKHKTTFIATSSVNAFFAPPGGAAYAASTAAIARAFEGLSLTHYDSNCKFSVLYPGPVATDGLKVDAKIPFVWSSEKMAKYTVNKVLKGKNHIENSSFYSMLTRLFRLLPKSLVIRILGKSK